MIDWRDIATRDLPKIGERVLVCDTDNTLVEPDVSVAVHQIDNDAQPPVTTPLNLPEIPKSQKV